MRPVIISGAGMIPFERRDQDSLVDMLAMAGLRAMDDARLGERSVDAVYVGNMASGLFNHQVSVASALVDRLALFPAAADRGRRRPAMRTCRRRNGQGRGTVDRCRNARRQPLRRPPLLSTHPSPGGAAPASS